jgi:Icc protein
MTKIAYLTDTHLDEPAPRRHGADTRSNFEKVAAAIDELQPDLVIFGGDMGTADSHRYFFDRFKTEVLVVAGNHDFPQELAPNIRQPLTDGELFYAMNLDGHLLIFLDSSTDVVSGAQLDFLEQQISKATSVCLFIHHPVLRVPSVVDDKYPLKNRDEVKRILLDSGAPVSVFCGHNHTEHETFEENITQYMTPAVSYQILKNEPRVIADVSYTGFRIIGLDGDIQTRVVTIPT